MCRAELTDPELRGIVPALVGLKIHAVGPRPGREIDHLLAGRVLVVGDDADLSAVVLRLLRRELLRQVVVAYVAATPTPVTDLHSLPTGAAAARLARLGDPDVVPLVRDDVGGILLGRAQLVPIDGTVYVDDRRVLKGSARGLIVFPDADKGLEATVIHNRVLGIGKRPRRYPGRAVQIGTTDTTVVADGVRYPRAMTRWTFYKHTEPLRLVRGVVA